MAETSNPLGSPVIKDLTPKLQQGSSPDVRQLQGKAGNAEAAKPKTA
jgi:hypothetical protein